MSINDAFKKGVKAYENYLFVGNKSINPYDKDSYEYKHWNLGWKTKLDAYNADITAEQHERHAGKFSSY